VSWQLASFLVLATALALGFAWYERSRPPARVLALVAALAALAVVGRIGFAPFPNVKPTTDIVLFAGYALGGAPGFAVGAVAAIVSDIFFLQGPWTPWHMAAWGGVGLAGGAIGTVVRRRSGADADTERGRGEDRAEFEPHEIRRWPLAAACGLAGLAFGLVMDLYMWTLGAEQTLAAYAAISVRSLPFNVAHVAGNVTFALLIGPPLVRALRRYRRRFEVRWPAPGAVPTRAACAGAALAVPLALAALAGTPAAEAASPAGRAASYLAGVQNGDGGFGSARGRRVDPALRRPRPLSGAARRRSGDGSFERKIDLTAFGVLALRAAGEGARSARVRESAAWLVGEQRPDGGFPANRFIGASDVDDTGAVLQALAAAGYAGDHPSVTEALRYLEGAQTPSGGFPLMAGGAPNAQSTAYALQGLVAIGRGRGDNARRALSYLRSLQLPDGSVRKSAGSRADPVWVTAQAASALALKAFPLDPVPLRPPA
jgi:energy-coupling factor transport system substrate-specific component